MYSPICAVSMEVRRAFWFDDVDVVLTALAILAQFEQLDRLVELG